MQVTITLGEKILEFVTGIPEEELPEILSDVLERSLKQQVRPIQSNSTSDHNNQDDLLDQIRNLLKLVKPDQMIDNPQGDVESTNVKRKAITELIKVGSAITDILGDDDLDEFSSLMK